MFLNALLILLHILSTIWLACGIVGREVTRAQMRATPDLKIFASFSQLAGKFESAMVRPGSMLLFLTGILLAFVQGRPLLGFLQGASSNWLLVANLLVISMILVIGLIFVPRGKVYERAMQDAVARNEITPALQASLQDPVVRAAHIYEEVATVLIIFLMVVKPF